MKTLFRVAVALLVLIGAQLSAGDYLQQYIRPTDNKVLLQKGYDGTIKKAKNAKWDADRGPVSGRLYYVCQYKVYDKQGNEVNDQLVWYYPNRPAGRDTDKCNYWVYWCNPKTKVIWGRCPTPHHPDYKKWKAKHGTDLWQIVPKEKREEIKGNLDPGDVVRFMNKDIIGEKTDAGKLPTVKPTEASSGAIICVDFENVTFF